MNTLIDPPQEKVSRDRHHDSEIVSYVHTRFHPKREEARLGSLSVSSVIVERVDEFLDRHRLWVYCRKIMALKKKHDLERAYLEVREELIQKLFDFKKNHKEDLQAHSRQMSHIEKVIKKCEERQQHFSRELERFRDQPGERSEESILRLESRLKEFEEEIRFRSHVLSVQKEIAANHFSGMTAMEKELCQLEVTLETMLQTAKAEALHLHVPESIALTLFYYIINDGYFTYIPEEEWHVLMVNVSSKEQTALKDHFHFEKSLGAYILNDEQTYTSPIQRKCLVGHKAASGISFLDYNVKKMLNDKLKALSFQSYLNEVKVFYTYLASEALSDGILTVEEMTMLDEIAAVIKLDINLARKILNQEAQRIQKNVINEQMMMFYDLAMADGVMQRDEAKFLVEMNAKLESKVIHQIAETMARRQNDLQLHLDAEELFVDMCKMVMKDGVLDAKECGMLMDFTQKQGWDKSKLQPILARALSSLM